MIGGPFRRKKDGIEVALRVAEAGAIKRVAEDLEQMLGDPDESMRRLFPPGYADDLALEEEFRAMTRDQLVTHKQRAVREVINSLEEGETRRGTWHGFLDADRQHAWLGVLNDARLVLGTTLDVGEDMEHAPLPATDPRAPAFNLYLYLGALEEALVEILLDDLPEGEPDEL